MEFIKSSPNGPTLRAAAAPPSARNSSLYPAQRLTRARAPAYIRVQYTYPFRYPLAERYCMPLYVYTVTTPRWWWWWRSRCCFYGSTKTVIDRWINVHAARARNRKKKWVKIRYVRYRSREGLKFGKACLVQGFTLLPSTFANVLTSESMTNIW